MNLDHERQAQAKGYRLIAGVDEAGRGPLAGPVVAAACILNDVVIPGLDDSKKLTPKKRASLFELITTHPTIQYGIGICTPQEIDIHNILQASLLAMLKAIDQLSTPSDYLLIDGNQLPNTAIPAQALIKGDSLSLSIAAASILAKHTRDVMMLSMHEKYPQYNFKGHKGYPTKAHIDALKIHGPCPIHRRSFGPVKHICQGANI